MVFVAVAGIVLVEESLLPIDSNRCDTVELVFVVVDLAFEERYMDTAGHCLDLDGKTNWTVVDQTSLDEVVLVVEDLHVGLVGKDLHCYEQEQCTHHVVAQLNRTLALLIF